MPTVTANADFAMLPHDRPFNGPSVLANDSTSSGTLTANLSHGPTNGSVLLNADGTYTYTPNAGFTGQDTFSYTASNGSESASATVMLTVNNAAPTANADVYTTNHDQTLTTTTGQSPQGLLGNDTDGDGDALTVTAVNGSVATVGTPVSLGAAGTVTVQADGTFSFTPAAGYIGQASFNYTVSDGVASSLATATINVVNQAPVANGDSLTLVHDYPKLNVNLTANDTDANGDALRPVIVQGPQNGTATVNDDGTVNYVPNAGYVGQDYFTYQATDGLSNSSIAMVTIGVTNQAPIAASDGIYYVRQNTPLLLNQLLVNDNDPDGEPLHPVIVQGPANGQLLEVGDGVFEYMPNSSFLGTDTFTYKLNDGAADSNVITLTLIVTDQSLAANRDAFALDQGDQLLITPGDLTANDQSSSSQGLQVVSITAPANGTLTQDGAGNWTYTPNAGFAGTETLTYTVSDGVNTAQATAALIVRQVQQQAAGRSVSNPTFSADGTKAAAAEGPDTIKVWDTGRMQGSQIITFPNSREIQALAISPRAADGFMVAYTQRLVGGGFRTRYGFWRNGAFQFSVSTNDTVLGFSYSPDGSLLAVTFERSVMVYSTDQTGKPVTDLYTPVPTITAQNNEVFAKAQFTDNSTLYVSGRQIWTLVGYVQRYAPQVAYGQTQYVLQGQVQVPQNEQLRSLQDFAASGNRVAMLTWTNRVLIYEWANNQFGNLPAVTWQGAANTHYTALAFNGNAFALGTTTGEVNFVEPNYLMGTASQRPAEGTFRHANRWITGLTFSGNTLASSSQDGSVILWDFVQDLTRVQNQRFWRSRFAPLR